DGSLEDSMRYAIDVAKLDFLASTDHASILPVQSEMMTGDDYIWWRIQKVDDLLFVPGLFTPIYPYERRMSSPAGHHNVIFPKRGGVPVPTDAKNPNDNDDQAFWNRVRGSGVLTFPHTPADRSQPKNDLLYKNPDFSPLMEIYQGFRSSYESVNTPPEGRIGNSQVTEPGHFYQDALKKGFRYGVESSSDHLSTHKSYTGVYAEELTREGLFKAMKARHTFAASDKIVVDFRIGEHMLGDEF